MKVMKNLVMWRYGAKGDALCTALYGDYGKVFLVIVRHRGESCFVNATISHIQNFRRIMVLSLSHGHPTHAHRLL